MTAPDSERILLRSRLHWGIFILPVFVLLGATLPTALVMFSLERIMNQFIAHPGFSTFWLLPLVMIPGALALLGALISFLKSEVLLTDQRLVFQTGFLFRFSGEIQLRQVETLSIMEPVLGRMFGYGTMTVIGTGGTAFPLSYLPKPQDLYRLLQDAMKSAHTVSKRTLPPASPSPSPGDDSRYMPKP